jgi:hypothetical protein
MPLEVTCPNCNHVFPLEDAIQDELKDSLEKERADMRKKMEDYFRTKDADFKQKEEALKLSASQQEQQFKQQLAAALQQQQKELETAMRKSIATDFENQLKLLQEAAADKEEKLKLARQKEMELLQKEQTLINKAAEAELNLQRQLIQEREKIKEQLQKEEQEKMGLKEEQYQLRMRELEKQIDDQKKLVDEMKRKAEQGSMQLQGEVQELMLEEILKTTFPFDAIEEVGKGVRGADCIQIIRNKFGNEAGKIIYESKRTKDFANDWIEKLKADMRTLGADVAIIVTQTLPKDMERFGEKDGVYICTFTEVRSVALLLRNALLKIYDAKKSEENKGDKMVMLYNYLTGNEFGEQWKAIREGFMAMKLSIQKERDAMERLWKVREKQLEKVMLNATHIRASIEGIAGSDAVNLNLIDDTDALLLES